jgi:hypothetical protein
VKLYWSAISIRATSPSIAGSGTQDFSASNVTFRVEVNHQRYVTQVIGTHLMYLENGRLRTGVEDTIKSYKMTQQGENQSPIIIPQF